MTQYSGETGDALAAARTALAEQNRAAGDADRVLRAVLDDAYRLAIESIRRIEAVQAAIDEVGQTPDLDSHTCARLLLDRDRELIDIVTAARDQADAKTIELQQLSAAYGT